MIDINQERLVRLNKAGELFPEGIQPSRTVLWRWASNGVKANGQIVKLETYSISRIPYTTQAAVNAFLAAQQPTRQQPKLTPGQRQRQAVAAKKVLDAAGI